MTDAATAHQSPCAIPSEWRRWVIENKINNLGDERIVSILISNGFSEQLSRQEVENIENSETFQVGLKLSQKLKKLESVLGVRHAVSSLAPDAGLVKRSSKISREDFLANYYAANRPVVLTDLLTNWNALSRWNPEYLKSKCGDVVVEVMTDRERDPSYEINMEVHKTTMLFGAFVDRVFAGGQTNDCYLTGNNHFLENPRVQSLLEDIEAFPEYLNPTIPGFTFFWFGPGGTITQPHHDEVNILMSQVMGSKSITLVSPEQTHLLYNHLGVYSDVDWDLPDYDRHPLFKRVKSVDVVLMPGETLFIPVGWWHHVKSTEPSLSISFCNFVFANEFQYSDPEIRD